MGLLRQGRPLEAVTLLDEALGRQPVSAVLEELRRAAVMRSRATGGPFLRGHGGGVLSPAAK